MKDKGRIYYAFGGFAAGLLVAYIFVKLGKPKIK